MQAAASVNKELIPQMFGRLTGEQLVKVFAVLPQAFRNEHAHAIEEHFKELAETSGFPDIPTKGSAGLATFGPFKQLLDFISPETFLTTNWVQSKSLQNTGPESFLLMMNKLFQYNEKNPVWEKIPKNSKKFNPNGLITFKERLTDRNYVEEGYMKVVGDVSHESRNDRIVTKLESDPPVFGIDPESQVLLHKQVQIAFKNLGSTKFQHIRDNMEPMRTQTSVEAQYLNNLFKHAPELAAHSIILEKIQGSCKIGYLVRNFIDYPTHENEADSSGLPRQLSRKILQQLPHELLVGKDSVFSNQYYTLDILLGTNTHSWGQLGRWNV
jgi:hypothetical protein